MAPDDTTPTTAPVSRQRRYSDQEQADALAALAENGGEVSATSRATGIPEATLRHWRDGDCRPISPELVEQRKSVRAAAYDDFADKALAVAMDKVDELDAKAAIIASAVATDKALLLRGQATSIVQHQDTERTARLKELYAKRAPVVVQAHTTAALPAPIEERAAEQPTTEGEAKGAEGQ
jgi:transposase-like protein